MKISRPLWSNFRSTGRSLHWSFTPLVVHSTSRSLWVNGGRYRLWRKRVFHSGIFNSVTNRSKMAAGNCCTAYLWTADLYDMGRAITVWVREPYGMEVHTWPELLLLESMELLTIFYKSLNHSSFFRFLVKFLE